MEYTPVDPETRGKAQSGAPPEVSVRFDTEEEEDYTYFSAEFTIAAGPAEFVLSTNALDPSHAGELAVFRAALASGADARLVISRRSQGEFWIELRGGRALFVFDNEGTTEGGLGRVNAGAPRAAAAAALAQFAAEWARLYPPDAGAGPADV